jgi:hypothetical protein
MATLDPGARRDYRAGVKQVFARLQRPESCRRAALTRAVADETWWLVTAQLVELFHKAVF